VPVERLQLAAGLSGWSAQSDRRFGGAPMGATAQHGGAGVLLAVDADSGIACPVDGIAARESLENDLGPIRVRGRHHIPAHAIVLRLGLSCNLSPALVSRCPRVTNPGPAEAMSGGTVAAIDTGGCQSAQVSTLTATGDHVQLTFHGYGDVDSKIPVNPFRCAVRM
jgi:hypothetical protein